MTALSPTEPAPSLLKSGVPSRPALPLSAALIGMLFICAIGNDLALVHEFPGLDGVLVILTLFVLLAVTAALMLSFPIRHLAASLRLNFWLILFLVGHIGVQLTFHRPSPGETARLLAYSVTAPVAFWLLPLIMINQPRLFRRWVIVCALGSGVIALTTIASAFAGESLLGIPTSLKGHESYRIGGLYASGGILEHPLTTGTQMIFGVGSAYLAMHYRRSPLMLFLIAACLVALLLTMSRGAWLAMAAGSTYFFLARWRLRQAGVTTLIFALALAFGGWAFYELAKQSPQLSKLLRLDMGLSNRETMWPLAVQMIRSQPWTGYGLGAAAELKTMLAAAGYRIGATESGFHNNFLDMAASSGVVVMALYLAVFVVPILRVARQPMDPDLRRILFALAIASLVSVVFVPYNIGGLRGTSLTLTVFLGLANLSPLMAKDAHATEQAPASGPSADAHPAMEERRS